MRQLSPRGSWTQPRGGRATPLRPSLLGASMEKLLEGRGQERGRLPEAERLGVDGGLQLQEEALPLDCVWDYPSAEMTLEGAQVAHC